MAKFDYDRYLCEVQYENGTTLDSGNFSSKQRAKEWAEVQGKYVFSNQKYYAKLYKRNADKTLVRDVDGTAMLFELWEFNGKDSNYETLTVHTK